jgi:LytTr DNA-binding domain
MTENAVHVSPTATTIAPTATTIAPVAAHYDAGFTARHRTGYILSAAIGCMMAVLAPLQTDYIPFWPRLAYWLILMLSGATIGLGVTELVERWGRLNRWPWVEIPVIGILIALPLTLVVMGTGAIFFGVSSGNALRFSYNFGVTALISIAVTALIAAVQGKPFTRAAQVQLPAEVEAEAEPDLEPLATPEASRFTERLPLPLRSAEIVALEAEDHYLRVHMEGGQSTLILMRLSDAIAELPADSGAQTHRSWWVSKDAVRSVAKADGRATLTLDGGVEAPVSRSFYKALGDKGWLV